MAFNKNVSRKKKRLFEYYITYAKTFVKKNIIV